MDYSNPETMSENIGELRYHLRNSIEDLKKVLEEVEKLLNETCLGEEKNKFNEIKRGVFVDLDMLGTFESSFLYKLEEFCRPRCFYDNI